MQLTISQLIAIVIGAIAAAIIFYFALQALPATPPTTIPTQLSP